LHGDKEIIELLIEKGADVNTYDNKFRVTPLHMIAELGQIEIVEMLLENGAYINPISRNMCTPLDSAEENVVDLLVSKGAKREKTREN
jgi:ankyrin repeat protein